MNAQEWNKVLKKAGLIGEDGTLTPEQGTILTIHAAGSEVAVKHGIDDVVIDCGEEIMTVRNKATSFVHFLPWEGVTKIEQRDINDHRYRHG